MIGEHINALDLYRRPVRNKLFPILLGRIGNRRRDDAKILGAFVGANVKEIAAMRDVVFVIGLTGDNDLPFRVRIVGRNVSTLSRSLAGSFQLNDGLVARAADADIKQLVFLFVNQVVLVGAQHMPKHLVVALGDRIFGDVEDRLVVGGPGHVINTFDPLRKQFAAPQVLHLQRVLSIARVVS